MKSSKTMKTKLPFKIIFFCAIFLIGSLSVEAQTGIHIQQYTSSAYVYNKDSVYMNVSFSTGYSHMALVNPATKEWKYLSSVNFNKYIGPFVMKNNMEGVMIYSSSSKVYKTSDGWQTLTDVGSVADGFGLSQIEVTDAGYLGYESARRDIYFSADGLTWNLVYDAGSGTNALRVKGNKVVFFSGTSQNRISTDGGQTFSQAPFGSSGFSGNFVDFVMVSEEIFILATTTGLYKTFDGGVTWSEKLLPETAIFSSIIVKDSAEIFARILSNESPHQYNYTSDGGDTWEIKTDPAVLGGPGGGRGSYIGNDLYMWPSYKSSDNGTTWELFLPQTLSNGALLDLSFNGNIGFAGKSGGKVMYSSDRGRSFSFNMSLPTNEDIMSVKVLNNGDFIAGDRNGQVYYSIDNGISWTRNYSNNLPYNAVKFSSSSDDNIIVVSRYGQPLVSTDHGNSFVILNVGGGSHAQSIKPNGEIIDVVGWFDYTTFQTKGWEISRWTPAGVKTILDTFLVANEILVDIHMTDDNVGYLLTYNNASKVTQVYKTTSGWSGASALISSINPVNQNQANYAGGAKIKMHSFGPDSLILVGDGNTYYHYSYDGGVTWNISSLSIHSDYPVLYPSLKKSHFFSPNEFIFALNKEGIYLNVNSSEDGTTGINELIRNDRGVISDNYLLNQNFPNPFNPATKISFSIPVQSFVSLKVYDVTGREVANLVNKEMSSGSSSASFDAAALSSGVYFYKLSTENFIQTKKMLLMK